MSLRCVEASNVLVETVTIQNLLVYPCPAQCARTCTQSSMSIPAIEESMNIDNKDTSSIAAELRVWYFLPRRSQQHEKVSSTDGMDR